MRTRAILAATAVAAAAAREPCDIVRDTLENDQDYPPQFVPAQQAYDCLLSIPVDRHNSEMIEEYKAFTQWQSSLAWLKDPPAGYEDPAIDVIAELTNIQEKLSDFTSDWEVHQEVADAIAFAHDGHFTFNSDILNVFTWIRRVGLVSVSPDGIDLPKIYTASDLALSFNDTSFAPSEVTTVDGELISDYLLAMSVYEAEQDIDVRYNNFFPYSTLDGSGKFNVPPVYVGPTTDLGFANGSSRTYENLARTRLDWTNVTDGQTFFDSFCAQVTPSTEEKRSPPDIGELIKSTTATLATGDDPLTPALNGYYLDDVPEVAVLECSSFAAPEDAGTLDHAHAFSSKVRSFLDEAKKDGKTKIVVDLRSNGGGNGLLAWDTFKNFFPQVEPTYQSRVRAHEDYLALAHSFDAVLTRPEINDTDPDAWTFFVEQNQFRDENWEHVLKADGSDFTSGDELYGPYADHNDDFTAIMRRNLSDQTSYGFPGFDITGYNSKSNVRDQLFNASDIIMLNNGICHSTCATFAELMKVNGQVRTIVVGGLPRFAPMQGVAGAEGLFLQQPRRIKQMAAATVHYMYDLLPEVATSLDLEHKLGKYASFHAVERRSADGNNFNLANVIQPGNDDVPQQFVYEAADCKLFYTAENYQNPASLWSRVYNVAWDYGKCVQNSTHHASSIAGGDNYHPWEPSGFEAYDNDVTNAANGGGRGRGRNRGGGNDDCDASQFNCTENGARALQYSVSGVAFVGAMMAAMAL